jgi:ABC-type phosphate transport system substrate-binding protein
MTRFHHFVLATAAALTVAATPAAAQDFKVIAYSDLEIAKADLAKLFLKQSNKLPDGTSAKPVDGAKGSPIRAAFSQNVLGRPVGAVEQYWQQQIFSGKDAPPPVKASDDEVAAFVKSTPGAIGYISAGSSAGGAKVVTVK